MLPTGNKLLSEDIADKSFYQVASGFRYLHQQPKTHYNTSGATEEAFYIMHCDLHAGNVLFRKIYIDLDYTCLLLKITVFGKSMFLHQMDLDYRPNQVYSFGITLIFTIASFRDRLSLKNDLSQTQ